MKKTISILICSIIIYGCELIIIGSKKTPQIEINQNTPIGAIYLFKTELDSNNIPAATQIIAHPSGQQLLALEKYELYDEVERLGRLVRSRQITNVKADSLSERLYKINLELDYNKLMYFTTAKIDDYWYIVSYSE